MSWAATTAKFDTAKSPNGLLSVPMADNEKIFKGDIVRINAAGYATSAGTPATADMFIGVATESVDNTVTGHTAGGLNITVDAERGSIHTFKFASGGITDRGTLAYLDVATDAQTVIGSAGTHAVTVGAIVEYISATRVRVAIDPCNGVAS